MHRAKILEQLIALRQAEKFAESEWEERGLNPSESSITDKMRQLTDRCLDELIKDVKDGASEQQVQATLVGGLNRFGALDFDTEEREFIADKFHEIGRAAGVDLGKNIQQWFYGS